MPSLAPPTPSYCPASRVLSVLAAMAALRLNALGSLALVVAAQPSSTLPVPVGKAQGLLLFLAMQRRPVSREALLDLFWPHLPRDAAANNLRVLLSNLRCLCLDKAERSPLQADRQHVALDASVMESDVIDFLRTPLVENAATPLPSLAELAPGFELPGCEEFNLWLEERRQDVRRSALLRVDMVIRRQREQNDTVGLIAALRARLVLQPQDEAGLRELMSLLCLRASAAAALDEYERFRARLHVDLGAEPEPESRRLAAQLRLQAANDPLTPGTADAAATAMVLCVYGEIEPFEVDDPVREASLREIQAHFSQTLASLGSQGEPAGGYWAFLAYLPTDGRPGILFAEVLRAVQRAQRAVADLGLVTHWGLLLEKRRWSVQRGDAGGAMLRKAREFILLAKPDEIVACRASKKFIERAVAVERTMLHRRQGHKRATRLFSFRCHRGG